MYDSPETLSYKKKTDLYILKTMLWGALLVATNLLNTYIEVLLKLDKNMGD